MPISDTVFRPGIAVLLSQNPVEQHDASDCTGTSGASNRVLTVTKSIFSSTIIVVDKMVMERGNDISVTGQDVTFLGALFDDSKIEVY